MPARDGRGPEGQGSLTGRGLGNCQPNQVVNNDNQNNATPQRGQGLGLGRGQGGGGRGRGFGRGFGRRSN